MEAWLAGVVAAGAGLYRRNAFRVGGLPATATPRQVRRRAGEVRAAEALGVEAPTDPPTDSPPDHAAVREALRRLDDPVARRLPRHDARRPPLALGRLRLVAARLRVAAALEGQRKNNSSKRKSSKRKR